MPSNAVYIEDADGPLLQDGVVALGFFDGCHIGHQKILATCRELGGDSASVFTFPNHPTTAIPGRSAPALVTTSEERIALLQESGLQVFLRSFDREFSSWSAEHFVSAVLKEKLGVRHVVVGQEYGFELTVIGAVMHEDTEPFVVSSTRIRQAVAEGDLMLAHQLMGRPFFVSGKVERGAQKGRTIGFPTANLKFPSDKVAPPFGVVAVRTEIRGKSYGGVANYGVRPTVDSIPAEPLLEVHLFDFEGDLYERELKVELCAFVRPEKKFSGLSELRSQIEADVAKVRRFFANCSR